MEITQEAVDEVPLEALAVEKYYGKIEALAGVSLAIPRGSVTALVGPNGAGKSTLLKIWVGFERPSGGTATVWGMDPWSERARTLPHLGYVPQTPSLYRSLSVADHLEIARRYRPSFDRALATRRLSDLGISDRAKASGLSGGQAAQLGLAIALATRADTLVLDEPLASLDPLARRDFLDVLIDDVGATGRTVVLSSHVISDIAQGCTRIVVLAVGRKMLDADITTALHTHWVVEDPIDPKAHDIIGPVGKGPTGVSWLTRQDPARTTGGRPPGLEDVVMAYLEAGRAAQEAHAGQSPR